MEKANCILLYGNHGLPISKYAGTFRIATELRNNGYSVQSIDITPFNGFDFELKQILDNLISDTTLWIGISTTFLYHIMGYPFFKTFKGKEFKHKKRPNLDENLIEFVNFVKGKNANIKLIAGGSRKFMLESYGFKIFSFYADKEIVEFTDWCAGSNKKPNLEFYGSHIQGTEFSEFNSSQIIFHESDIIDKNDALPMEISRGCIFKCKFCSFPMNGKSKGEWIKKSSILLDEFKRNYEHYGVTNYIFSDDTYNDSIDKVKMLYDDVYSKLGFDISFTTYIRLDLMIRYPEMSRYLKESGLVSALFGIETINKDSGVAIGKGLDPIVQFEYIKEIKRNDFKDIMTHSGIIIGLPKDRPDEMSLLEEFIFSDDNQLDHIVVDPLYLTPNTTEFAGHRKFYSAFDNEFDSYGYECYIDEEGNAMNEVKWKNDSINMTFDSASEFANKINNRIMTDSDKFKFGGFIFPYYLSLGIPKADLLTLSKRQLAEKYDIKAIIESRKQTYKQLLLRRL